MIEKVRNNIKKFNLIENGESVVVGVSGGPDSVCLLHVLNSIACEFNIEIFAVHINHMLRGAEADMDEEYVRTLCAELKIPLFSSSYNIKEISEEKGISLEEAGREIRYKEFELVANNLNSSKIAVAHNKNDQAETVLMHIIRGTGLDGLKGMEIKRGKIIRPLLDVSRIEIEDYCERFQLKPRIDSSNLENIYTRNKVRLDLIPYINQMFNTEISENIIKMAALLKDDGDFIEGCVQEYYRKCILKIEEKEVWLNLLKFKDLHSAVKKRIIRTAINEVKGDLKGIENVHVESAIDMATSGRTGSQLHLPQGLRIMKSYDTLKILIESEEDKFSGFIKHIEIPGTTVIEESEICIESDIIEKIDNKKSYTNIQNNANIQFFDYQEVYSGISVRNRKNGDIFRPLKFNGTKKLKEYFIDTKIPRDLRDKIPLIAKENEIVWIIGYKISDKFKVTENTKSVLRLKYIEK